MAYREELAGLRFLKKSSERIKVLGAYLMPVLAVRLARAD